jgi:DNA polymerase-4
LELASGVDDRPVESERPVKSISHEETFAYDLFDRTDIRTQLVRMADGVATRLRASGLGARTISLKVRDATFTTLTRSRTLPRGVDTAAAIVDVVVPLMDQVEPTGGVRLLGVVASKFAEPSEQLQLDGITADGDTSEQWSEASAAIDRVRGRFGSSAIGPASALSADGLRIVRRGQQQWGTNEQSGSETARNDRPPD